MRKHTRKRAVRMSVLAALGGALAFVAAGLALAAPNSPQTASAGYRLTAQLTAAQEVPAGTGSTSAKGRFDGLLVRTGPGQAAKVGALPAGCKVVSPSPRSGLPTKIVCDNGRLTLPLPKVAGVRWTLAWRLTFSGLTGPATAAHIHLGAHGPCRPGRDPALRALRHHGQGHLARHGRPGNRASPRRRLRQRAHRQEHGRRDPRPDPEDRALADNQKSQGGAGNDLPLHTTREGRE